MTDSKQTKIFATVFLVFFIIVAVGMMVFSFDMMDDDFGPPLYLILPVFAAFIIFPLFAIYTVWTGKGNSIISMNSLLNRQYERTETAYCPMCHANMGNSTKCPECSYVKK